MRCVPLFLLALLTSVSALRAQVVSGVLLEAETRVPLAGGLITLLDADSATVVQVRTDSVGGFGFTLDAPGAYRLRAERVGYLAATSPRLSLGETDTLQVEFSLAQNVVMLDPLVVTARSRRLTAAARRFYERAEVGAFGRFITRDDIERLNPLNVTDLFNRIPGVRTTPMLGGNAVTIRGDCRPTLYMDGVRVNGYRSIDDLASPLDVEGIEVYRSTHEAPVEYQGLLAGCAVVLIWTRIE